MNRSLQDELRKAEREKKVSVESESVDRINYHYLKNIVIKFLETPELRVRFDWLELGESDC